VSAGARKGEVLINTLRLLQASEAATQPIPRYVNLNFEDLFKIQQVRRNIFALKPVSFSSLAAYLECPGCALDQKRKKRSKEPTHFTDVHQATLFGGSKPNPQLVGTLLHQVINLLHDTRGSLSEERRETLLTDPKQLTHFLRHETMPLLQAEGKLKLAMFLDELSVHEGTFYSSLVTPLLRYQQELRASGSTVFASAERFQCKLVSTGKTFADHGDRGGEVAIVGEFDQIRLRNVGSKRSPGGRPAIIDFKTGLGKRKRWDTFSSILDAEPDSSNDLEQPGIAHAMQLAIYWLAFQTRWDILEHMLITKGRVEDVRMPFQQNLDLLVYNLYDGCQYQLAFTNTREALQSLINCIFYLNWAMKSGYTHQVPEHDCRKTSLLTELPPIAIQVGYQAIPAAECYLLAQEAFQTFKETVRWKPISAG
jgi:hypothetical protein